MLHEPASSFKDRPQVRPGPAVAPVQKTAHPLDVAATSEYQPAVASILKLPRVIPADPDSPSVRETLLMLGASSKLMASYTGELLLPSEEAYAQLDAQLAPQNALALFRPAAGDSIVIHIVRGRPEIRKRPIWPNVLLFALTVLSLLMVGTAIAAGEAGLANSGASDAIMNDLLPNLWRGLPYTISLLLILGTHEMGHFFAARAHKTSVTLPYFIPAPPFLSPIGTAGAFIQIREPIRSRRALIDIGAAGPLAGLAVAIPILFIGLATSQLVPPAPVTLQEGNSLLYALAKVITFGQFVPNGTVDVMLNQLAQAAWTGLLVTALNLIPLGQLDGGHILYALIGERARSLYYPVLILTVIMVVAVSEAWLFWLILLFLFGRFYAAPLNMATPLTRHHQAIAVLALVVFVVTFVPIPFAVHETVVTPLPGQSLGLMLPVALVFMLHRLRRARSR
ncbi:MAG TPA: site-2 protease family protein [Candidatus Limnocylindrales bacterium]|nr:site-2 protease family protein [Candidatus Limnocylindrales bacterium]